MKTSILISSIAALCLMITFAEAPSRLSSDNSNTDSESNISFIPVTIISSAPEANTSLNTKEKSIIRTDASEAENLDYLKFDASDFAETDNSISEEVLPADELESTFDYLKFDVADYSGNESAADEMIELPVNEFEYLKFDVADYSGSTVANAYESIEMPLNEYEYLKFDVTDYTSDDVTSDEMIELPVNEFDYLKFDVDKYITADGLTTSEINDLPVDEYSYLKFDINKYSNSAQATDYLGELPVSE